MKTHILMHDEAHCPSCRRGFTMDFVEDNFSRSFRRTDLRKNQVAQLAEREKGLYPMTMEHIRVIQADETRQNALLELHRNIRTLTISYELNDALVATLRQLCQTIQENTNVRVQTDNVRNVRTMPCPKAECKGYIPISNSGTCALCQTKVCRRCREISTGEHVCDENTLRTIEALADTTKPCPKCSMAIERISGCAQMFCTQCHTAWDWNSGRVINGPIHNPHYFAYLQQTGLEIQNANVNCEDPLREFSIRNLRTGQSPCKCTQLPTCTTNCFRHAEMFTFFRIGNWVIEMIQRANPDYNENTYLDLRIRYLRNQLCEKQYLTQLSCRETFRRRTVRINEVYFMFVTALRDTLMLYNQPEHSLEKITGMIENLRVYTIGQLGKIYGDSDRRYFQFFDSRWNMSHIGI
jgi:hypothetical protein